MSEIDAKIELAAAVEKATQALNAALSDAHLAGLEVSIEQFETRAMSDHIGLTHVVSRVSMPLTGSGRP